MNTLLRADIPVNTTSVIHYKEKWKESEVLSPNLLLDFHSGIYLTTVDWYLLTILILFGDTSILSVPPAVLKSYGLPSQLANAHRILTESDNVLLSPSEYS
tara:strand:- start:228 stop:530 length:303 start_codon:yes stop_codon:yes gene_type:complete